MATCIILHVSLLSFPLPPFCENHATRLPMHSAFCSASIACRLPPIPCVSTASVDIPCGLESLIGYSLSPTLVHRLVGSLQFGSWISLFVVYWTLCFAPADSALGHRG